MSSSPYGASRSDHGHYAHTPDTRPPLTSNNSWQTQGSVGSAASSCTFFSYMISRHTCFLTYPRALPRWFCARTFPLSLRFTPFRIRSAASERIAYAPAARLHTSPPRAHHVRRYVYTFRTHSHRPCDTFRNPITYSLPASNRSPDTLFFPSRPPLAQVPLAGHRHRLRSAVHDRPAEERVESERDH